MLEQRLEHAVALGGEELLVALEVAGHVLHACEGVVHDGGLFRPQLLEHEREAALLLHQAHPSDTREVGERAQQVLHDGDVALRRGGARQRDGLRDGARRLSQAAQHRRLVLTDHVRQQVREAIDGLGRGSSVEARQAGLQLRSRVHA